MATRTVRMPNAASPESKPSPDVEPAVSVSKIINRGLHLVFDFDWIAHEKGSETVQVEVVISRSERWMEDPRSGSKQWSTTLLGDGWIAACHLHPKSWDDTGWDEPSPMYTAILRRFRDGLVAWIDGQEWIGRSSVEFGGNGNCVLSCEVPTEDCPGGYPTVDISLRPSEMSE